MTLTEFLTKLTSLNYTWHLTPQGRIRNNKHMCPIEAVYYDLVGDEKDAWVKGIAERVGMTQTCNINTMSAADNNPTCDKSYRDALLKAVGLDTN